MDGSFVIKAPPSPYAAEVFTGIKTKTGNLPKLAYAPAAVSCSVRLRSIFDHRYPVPLSNRHDSIHLCRHSIQMHGDNCLGARCDRRFEFVRVERAAERVDIDENRCRADIANRPCSCYERHRDRYDFVSWTDIQTAQSQMQRGGAAVQADTMINSAIRCKFGLEL